MSKTTFSNKCDILGTLWIWHSNTEDDTWREFFEWGDVGLPLSYLVKQGYATAKDEGKAAVEECWNVFCEMIDIDPDLRYLSLEDAFSASANDPLE